MITRPPIVGVPCFSRCRFGPSSRICWPNSLRRRKAMNVGPLRIAMIIATSAATSTLVMSAGKILRDDLESHRQRALHEHRVAGAQHLAQSGGRLVGRSHPFAAVGAGELADRDHLLDPELAHERADLGVVGR